MKKFLFFYLMIFTLSSVAAQTVYVTETGEKYHRESCQYLSKSKIRIELSEAAYSGYSACSKCKPQSISRERASSYNVNSSASKTSSSKSVQCSGKTQKGYRCKRMTTNRNGRCYQH